MDEQKLQELFRDAVRDAPPASFTEEHVRMASERARLRRRTSIITGSAVAVAILAGGAVTGGMLWGDPADPPNTASGAAQEPANGGKMAPYEAGAPGVGTPSDRAQEPQPNVPMKSPEQGGTSSGKTGPSANGCGQVDRELAAALAGELPAAAVTDAPQPAALNCPPGSRAVAYRVKDGNTVGRITVLLTPKLDEPTSPWQNLPASMPYPTRAASGQVLVLVSEPEHPSSPVPFGKELAAIAGDLANRF